MSEEIIALKLQVKASELENSVLQLLRNCNISDLCYAYKIRTKTDHKLLEKLARKRKEKSGYMLDDITDVLGLRLVALFKHDMLDLLDGILSAIDHSNSVNPNPFIKNKIEEVKIYKGANAFDELSPRLLSTIKKHFADFTAEEINSKEGYSSIHIVARLNATAEGATKNIPIEIQIRTVFEDAWGEIDHKYGYVVRTGKDSGKPINNPESVLAHLKVLKKFSDACVEYADCIRHDAVGISLPVVFPKKVISVTSDEFILSRFSSLGLTQDLIDRYKDARNLKNNAAELKDNFKYLDAAEKFKEFADTLTPCNKSNTTLNAESLCYYYARMNEAVCLMSTNEISNIAAARSIYALLDDGYSRFPLLHMRLGQALGKLGYYELALEELDKCSTSVTSIENSFIGKEEQEWPDELPLADYKHIVRTEPKLYGYYLWLNIKSLGSDIDQQIKYNMFLTAYMRTKLALEHVDSLSTEELSLNNNLLYYAIGAFCRTDIPKLQQTIQKDQLKIYIDTHVKYIEDYRKHTPKISLTSMDTLMKATWLLGRKQDASKLADQVIQACIVSETDNGMSAEEKLSLMVVANKIKENQEFSLID